jgi:hypothetical protein
MAEYIDRMKVRIAIIDTKWICDQDEDVAYEMIDSIPAADVEEVRHGRWIEHTHDDGDGVGYILYHCSLCDTPDARERNYCRECGAKMDGGKENEIE